MRAESADVLVIGAGIAGSVMAREARRRGLSVLVFDPSPETAASRAALAIGKDSWHKGNQRERAAWSLRWYGKYQWASFPTAAVSSAKHGAKEASDFYLIDPIGPLVAPDIYMKAWVTDRGEVRASAETDDAELIPYVGRLVVVAAGPRTWDMLNLPAGSIRWGHTLVSATAKSAAPLVVHNYAPYHSLVVARVGNTVRLGSTMDKSFDKSRAKVYDLLRMAEQQGFLSESRDWKEISGIRAMHPEETGRPIWTGDHVVAFSGFARCGYTLAPARAAEVLDRAFN